MVYQGVVNEYEDTVKDDDYFIPWIFK